MSNTLRARLALTQEMMALWLDVPRSSLALAERQHQPMPLASGIQEGRLLLATEGKVYDPATGSTHPAPPPLPAPAPLPEPLRARLRRCQGELTRLQLELDLLRRKAQPYEARLATLPALRAFPGPVPKPEREAQWLDLFEQEAVAALQYSCGAGPQRLLEARIAGLQQEAALLQELLDQQNPALP